MDKLTHLSLFSGIGGLDLAAEWAGFETVGQCEWADYPTKVLEKHWPDVTRWRDIHGLSANEFLKRTGIQPGELTCISGGFPCQPHSVAGLRKASSDERDLWPEYRRVVSEIKPRWVVAENVRGLLTSEDGRFFRGILRDFSDMGYDVGWCCYRAADVGAIHSRNRIAIIAYCRSQRLRTSGDNWPEWSRWESGVDQNIEASPDTACSAGEWILPVKCEKISDGYTDKGQWGKDWLLTKFRADVFACTYQGNDEYCKPLICRNDDGFSKGMDRDKCLGNAVVPQQFYPIFKVIAEIESLQ